MNLPADHILVASFPLPISVRELAGIVDELTAKHGRGLFMREEDGVLLIFKREPQEGDQP